MAATTVALVARAKEGVGGVGIHGAPVVVLAMGMAVGGQMVEEMMK